MMLWTNGNEFTKGMDFSCLSLFPCIGLLSLEPLHYTNVRASVPLLVSTQLRISL